MTAFQSLVPEPARPVVDWPALWEAFDWLCALDGCPQDPVFHAEGDVAIHTRLVVEALLADPRWQQADACCRAMLFWAALLHDVAKPATTRTDERGRVAAPGHSRRGQIMARRILWRLGLPFAEREIVAHLVTHHQLPFHLIERAGAERRLHLASHQTRCDLLAILATADARGRICPDQGRLLDNIALFEAMAADEGCLAVPKAFATPHSRFLYFRSADRDAGYRAFDDWRGEVTLMSGLPAAGKDSWIARHAVGHDVVSLDALRLELDVDAGEPQGAVIAAARERARQALRAGRPLIWNATCLSRRIRRGLIDLFADYRMRVHIVYLEAGEAELARRNKQRARPVPAAAIERMLDHWEPPDLTECHELVVQAT